MKSKTKNRLKITAAAILSVLTLRLILALIPKEENFEGKNPMMKDGELPLLIAHGGGNREFPDNTLEAFYNAYSVDEGVMMETDVSITKDGIVAVKSGVATLTVTAGNQSASCEIVVSAPAVGDEQDNDNSVSITIGACVGALVLIGIASVLIYRRF